MKKYRLRVLSGAGLPETIELFDGFTVGRMPDTSVFVRDDTLISRRHCEFRILAGKVRVRDLKSHNGTWVNGKKVADAVLASGDEIRAGGVRFVLDESAD